MLRPCSRLGFGFGIVLGFEFGLWRHSFRFIALEALEDQRPVLDAETSQ